MTRVQKERFFNEADYIRLKDTYILTPDKLVPAKENLTIKDLAERSGVGRSSLHRFLDPESPDIPKVATLDKIISKLPCFADDFLYSPDNYKKWESAYSGYRLNFGKSFAIMRS